MTSLVMVGQWFASLPSIMTHHASSLGPSGLLFGVVADDLVDQAVQGGQALLNVGAEMQAQRPAVA